MFSLNWMEVLSENELKRSLLFFGKLTDLLIVGVVVDVCFE